MDKETTRSLSRILEKISENREADRFLEESRSDQPTNFHTYINQMIRGDPTQRHKPKLRVQYLKWIQTKSGQRQSDRTVCRRRSDLLRNAEGP